MPSTLLTGCLNQWFLIVTRSSWWILPYCNLLWGWFDVCPWASLSACSLLLHCVGEAFHLTNLPSAVGKSWSQLHHQCKQKSCECWDHSISNFGYRWGRQRKAGNDNYLLEPSDAISTLVQWDSPRLGVVVVKVFTNSPYLPLGTLPLFTCTEPPIQWALQPPNSPLLCCTYTGCSHILPLRSSFHERKREMG